MRRAWWFALAACGLPEAVLEGEHVRLAADPGHTLCGDGVGHMDAFVAAVAEEFGVAAPTGEDRIEFYWLDRVGLAERTICVRPGACVWAGKVYSSAAPADHELVHAVVEPLGTPTPFLIEGLAVAYELPSPVDGTDDRLPQLSAISGAIDGFEVWRDPQDNYGLAGAFVSFLIERHGIAAVLRVYERSRLLDTSGRVSRLFSEELGESLAESEALFAALRSGCRLRAARRKLFECAAPEIAWDGLQFAEHRTLDCDQDDVVGPFGGEILAVYHTLELPARGVYELTVIGDADLGSSGWRNRLRLIRCGGCDGYAEVDMTGADGARRVTLPAGRYSLQRIGPAGEATGIGVRIEWLAPADEPGPGKPAKPVE